MSGSLPIAVIVGRPNVGKSTLFNRIARRRISIVAPEEGVTRDRVSTVIEASGKHFEVVDTAGAFLSEQTDMLTRIAMKDAPVVLLVVDAVAGLMPGDETLARSILAEGRTAFIVANKTDNPDMIAHSSEFHGLGIEPVIPCSAKHGLGVSDVTGAIAQRVPQAPRPPQHEIGVAIVGRRNSGKSTLLNRIAGHHRVAVSDEPGTTRDSVDVTIAFEGRNYVFVDTAGMLRRSRVKTGVDFYSMVRSHEAIRRCDVCLFLIDCTMKIGKVEKQLAEYISCNGKPCVLVFSKWDLAENGEPEKFRKYAERYLPVLGMCPMSFASAKTGFNIEQTLRVIPELHTASRVQIPTPAINNVLKKIASGNPPPARRGKAFKVYYVTQTAMQPPTFTLFVNDPDLATPSYRRFLNRSVREECGLEEIPIRLRMKSRR